MNTQKVISALREALSELEKKEPKTYRIGQRFRKSSGDVYLLSCCEMRKCVLIGLDGGNRWDEPVRVGDSYSITEDEFRKITDNKEFYLIDEP